MGHHNDAGRAMPGGWLLLVVAVAAGQVGYALVDSRLPWDHGLFHLSLPAAWELWAHPGSWGELLALTGHTGGLYDVALGLLLRVFGRSPAIVSGVQLGWLLGLIGLTGWVVRREAGHRAGLTAAILASSVPLVFGWARVAWIHLPEATLALGVLAVLQGDPGLGRGRSRVAFVALGLGLLSLRPSSLVWAAPLAVAAGWGMRRVPRRLGVLGGAWLLAALPALMELPTYLEKKAQARPRYLEQLPPLSAELATEIGLVPLVLGVVGVGVLVWRRRAAPVPLVLGTWLGCAVVAAAWTHAGLFNHTLTGPALAGLAALGLGRTRLAVPLAAAAWLLAWVPQVLPAAPPLATWGLAPTAAPSAPRSPHRVWLHPSPADTLALVDAACAGRARCVLAVDHKLAPWTEAEGRTELFLTRPEVVVEPARVWVDPGFPAPDALLAWSCDPPLERLSGGLEGRARLARMLSPARVVDYGSCSLVLLTPGGLARGSLPGAPPTPDTASGPLWATGQGPLPPGARLYYPEVAATLPR